MRPASPEGAYHTLALGSDVTSSFRFSTRS